MTQHDLGRRLIVFQLVTLDTPSLAIGNKRSIAPNQLSSRLFQTAGELLQIGFVIGKFRSQRSFKFVLLP